MRNVPKIVVKRLQGMAVADPHPALDLLTAFAEQSLGRSERAPILDHLARCSECRQILELAMPVTESNAVIRITSSRPVRLSWPMLRWGFVTAAMVAFISVGVLRYEHQRREPELASSSSPSAQVASRQTVAINPESSELVVRSPKWPPQEAKPAAGSRQMTAPSQAVPIKRNFQDAKRFGPNGETKSEAGAEAIARAQTSDQLIQNQAAASQSQPYASSDVVKAKAAVPSQNTGDTGPAPAPSSIAPQTAQSLMQPASPRWTINAGGLQRSFDAGKTWEDVNVGAIAGLPRSKLAFRVVASLGPEVWAGGTAATLYHSNDSGTSWQQIFPSDDGAQPAGDIIEIEFSSPQQGRITTSAGDTWTTSDSGRTWRKQP